MSDNLVVHALKLSQSEEKTISVFSDSSDPGNCSCGYIDHLSGSLFIMKHISPEGLNDGYIVRKIDDIIRVDYYGSYEKKIQLLYKLQKQNHGRLLEHLNISSSSNLFVEVFLKAKEKKLLVSLSLDEDQEAITGFVKNVDQDSLTASVFKLSDQGEFDGVTSFSIEDVDKVNCDTSDERTIQLLFNERAKQEDLIEKDKK